MDFGGFLAGLLARDWVRDRRQRALEEAARYQAEYDQMGADLQAEGVEASYDWADFVRRVEDLTSSEEIDTHVLDWAKMAEPKFRALSSEALSFASRTGVTVYSVEAWESLSKWAEAADLLNKFRKFNSDADLDRGVKVLREASASWTALQHKMGGL